MYKNFKVVTFQCHVFAVKVLLDFPWVLNVLIWSAILISVSETACNSNQMKSKAAINMQLSWCHQRLCTSVSAASDYRTLQSSRILPVRENFLFHSLLTSFSLSNFYSVHPHLLRDNFPFTPLTHPHQEDHQYQ